LIFWVLRGMKDWRWWGRGWRKVKIISWWWYTVRNDELAFNFLVWWVFMVKDGEIWGWRWTL